MVDLFEPASAFARWCILKIAIPWQSEKNQKFMHPPDPP